MENTRRKHSMKSDAKQRRERAIVRLEAQLKAGTKVVGGKFTANLTNEQYESFLSSQHQSNRKHPVAVLTDKDRERIQKEIDVLKSRI